jgi:zinc protease
MKTDLNEDQVVVSARSPGGNLLADMDKYYSATQADNFASLSGLGENDITTIQKILADKKASVSPYINDYFEGFNGQASPDDLEELFQMIHLYFTSPRIDQTAIEASIDRLKENVKNSVNNPNSVFSDSVNNVLYNYHPRQFNWDEEKISQINSNQAYNWFRNRFADASDFTFYFVGKYEDGVMNEMITKYLASLPTQDRKENWKDRDIRVVDGPLKKIVKIGKEPKSNVQLRIDGPYPEYGEVANMKMFALSRALGILLTEQLREETQIVYTVGAFDQQTIRPEKTYTVNVRYQCDPERVDEGIKVVKDQMKYLQNNKLDEEYMNRVREVIVSQYKKAFESNYFWASYLQSVDWNEMKMDRAQSMLDLINNLTADDIQNSAKKYFKLDEMKEFIRLPENM